MKHVVIADSTGFVGRALVDAIDHPLVGIVVWDATRLQSVK